MSSLLTLHKYIILYVVVMSTRVRGRDHNLAICRALGAATGEEGSATQISLTLENCITRRLSVAAWRRDAVHVDVGLVVVVALTGPLQAARGQLVVVVALHEANALRRARVAARVFLAHGITQARIGVRVRVVVAVVARELVANPLFVAIAREAPWVGVPALPALALEQVVGALVRR